MGKTPSETHIIKYFAKIIICYIYKTQNQARPDVNIKNDVNTFLKLSAIEGYRHPMSENCYKYFETLLTW